MSAIEKDKHASLTFRLKWKSESALHTEEYYVNKVNFWRDIFPEKVKESLWGKQANEQVRISFAGKEIYPYSQDLISELKKWKFENKNNKQEEPHFGRFYPKGYLMYLSEVSSQDITPFRCIGVEDKKIKVDFNYPFAGRDFELQIDIHDVRKKKFEHGGVSHHWLDTITYGPGMQTRWNNEPTDFFSHNLFSLQGEKKKRKPYHKKQFSVRFDDRALQNMGKLNEQLLETGMDVLEISDGETYIPHSVELNSLVGMGHNDELKNNFEEYRIQDLNKKPHFSSEDQFDAIVTTGLVEHLVNPLQVFESFAANLKSGGLLLNMFSNRYVTHKITRLWNEVYEFERMGVVLEYFLRTRKFENLNTCSIRGWPRPEDDPYYPLYTESDPVYAVWGFKS